MSATRWTESTDSPSSRHATSSRPSGDGDDDSTTAQGAYVCDEARQVVLLRFSTPRSVEQWRRLVDSALSDDSYRTSMNFGTDQGGAMGTCGDEIARAMVAHVVQRPELRGRRGALVLPLRHNAQLTMLDLAVEIYRHRVPLTVRLFVDHDSAVVWASYRCCRATNCLGHRLWLRPAPAGTRARLTGRHAARVTTRRCSRRRRKAEWPAEAT